VFTEPFSITVSLSTLLKTTRRQLFRDLIDTTRTSTFNDTPLGRLHNELFACFADTENIELDSGKVRGELVLAGSPQKKMVDLMLNSGYTSRYQDQQTLLDIAHLVLDNYPASATLAAVQDFGDGCIVLGTLRVAWNNLEVFQLYEIPGTGCWPHETFSQPFGEAGKLSMHPLLDLLSSSSQPELSACGSHYKEMVYRKAMEPAMAILQEKGINFFYYVAPPNVQRFLERAGPPFTRVEEVVLRTSPVLQPWLDQMHLYFKPSDPPEKQPHVYFSPVLSPSAWHKE
jgi:hypothetical protein